MQRNGGGRIDAFHPHEGTGGRQPRLMAVCRTPDVLQKLGAPDLPMTMTADNLGKVLSDKVDHGLPKELVKQLPQGAGRTDYGIRVGVAGGFLRRSDGTQA